MALEILNGAIFEGSLNFRQGRVGKDDVSSFLKLDGPFQRTNLDFSTDVLCTLSPLQLNGIEFVFFQHVFGNAEAGVFDVHLHKNFPVALIIASVGFDAAVHLR
jgi:hypothetical protein